MISTVSLEEPPPDAPPFACALAPFWPPLRGCVGRLSGRSAVPD